MLIYKDVLSGDELLSDSYNIKARVVCVLCPAHAAAS
jgi:hypothetical protein